MQKHNNTKTGIIVFGHTRPVHLRTVLESLRRQGAGSDVHVWLDGHSGRRSLLNGVEQCRTLVRQIFPDMHATMMNGHIGIEKMTLDGLCFMSRRYERIIVLEDDCFPTASAVVTFEAALDEIENQSHIYSVYGHHFLTPSEGETITRFQGWGWATTARKLMTILPQLQTCISMSEIDYIKWVATTLNPEIRKRLDVTPGRNCIEVMLKFFSWDSCTCLLTAQNGLVHKKTPHRVIYNCGMYDGDGHFAHDGRFRQPPFNMITVKETWDCFDDSGHVHTRSGSLNAGDGAEDAQSLNEQGEVLFARGDADGALRAFQKALTIDQRFAPALNNIGVVYWHAGLREKALQHISQALEIAPDDRSSILNCGEILRSTNRTTSARRLYSSYLEQHPEDSEVSRMLAALP